jgi:hypothetical protein
MAEQSTRRLRFALIGGAAAVVVAGGTGVAIAAASGPGSSTPSAAPPSSGSSAPTQTPTPRKHEPHLAGTGDLGARQRDPDQRLRWVHPHDQDEQ